MEAMKTLFVFFIFIAVIPIDLIIGNNTNKANRFRKNTTSRTCMFSEAFLIKTTMIENRTIDKIFRIIALD